jgi:hypothetical protein
MAAYAPLAGIPQVTQGQEQLNQNALAEYTRAAQEKQQTALLQQQTVAAQQQNQATQAVNQAYQGAFKKDANGNMTLDTDGLQQALAANGHGAAVPAVMKGILDYQTAKTAQQEQLQKLQAGGADALGSLGYALQQANYDPQLAHTIIQDHLNDPGLDPQHRQQLVQEQQAIAQNPALIKQMADQWVAQSPAQQAKNIERQKAEADTTKAGASQQEADTKQQEADQKNWEVVAPLGVRVNKVTGEQQPINGAAMSPQMMEGKYVALQQKLNSGQQLSPEDAAFAKGYEKLKTLVPVANFNLQNSGAAADAGGNPSQIAQALADNRMKWSEAVSPRTPQSVKNAIMAQVFKLNPNYDTSEFGLESDAAKKARSGAWADTRLAYNTAIDHADQLLSASDALKNGDVKKLNQLKNYFSTQFGSPDVTNFQAIANAYNHEVTSVVSKGHITDAEVAQGHATLPDNASPEQIRGVAQAYKNLMTSKRDELDKIIKAGAGNKANAVTSVQAGQSQTNDFFSQFGGKARNQ